MDTAGAVPLNSHLLHTNPEDQCAGYCSSHNGSTCSGKVVPSLAAVMVGKNLVGGDSRWKTKVAAGPDLWTRAASEADNVCKLPVHFTDVPGQAWTFQGSRVYGAFFGYVW